jgi:hypothetical protein
MLSLLGKGSDFRYNNGWQLQSHRLINFRYTRFLSLKFGLGSEISYSSFFSTPSSEETIGNAIFLNYQISRLFYAELGVQSFTELDNNFQPYYFKVLPFYALGLAAPLSKNIQLNIQLRNSIHPFTNNIDYLSGQMGLNFLFK